MIRLTSWTKLFFLLSTQARELFYNGSIANWVPHDLGGLSSMSGLDVVTSHCPVLSQGSTVRVRHFFRSHSLNNNQDKIGHLPICFPCKNCIVCIMYKFVCKVWVWYNTFLGSQSNAEVWCHGFIRWIYRKNYQWKKETVRHPYNASIIIYTLFFAIF